MNRTIPASPPWTSILNNSKKSAASAPDNVADCPQSGSDGGLFGLKCQQPWGRLDELSLC
jgi:hypothetical protein